MTTPENSKPEVFRNNFVKSIKFLNKKARKEALTRSRDLDEIFAKLCLYEVGISEVEDLAREEFRGAVQRYTLGFYEDAISHACFSVEMALLIKLDEKLSDDKKSEIYKGINRKEGQPRSFTFGDILSEAQSKEARIVRGKELGKKIIALLEKRNTYIHATNFLSGLIITMKGKINTEIETMLKDLEKIDNIPLVGSHCLRLKVLLEEKHKLIESFPNFSWCSKDKHRLNTQRSVEEYIQRLNEVKREKLDMSSNIKAIISAMKLKGTVRDILSTTYFKGESREIVECSFEILTELGIF